MTRIVDSAADAAAALDGAVSVSSRSYGGYAGMPPAGNRCPTSRALRWTSGWNAGPRVAPGAAGGRTCGRRIAPPASAMARASATAEPTVRPMACTRLPAPSRRSTRCCMSGCAGRVVPPVGAWAQVFYGTGCLCRGSWYGQRRLHAHRADSL